MGIYRNCLGCNTEFRRNSDSKTIQSINQSNRSERNSFPLTDLGAAEQLLRVRRVAATSLGQQHLLQACGQQEEHPGPQTSTSLPGHCRCDSDSDPLPPLDQHSAATCDPLERDELFWSDAGWQLWRKNEKEKKCHKLKVHLRIQAASEELSCGDGCSSSCCCFLSPSLPPGPLPCRHHTEKLTIVGSNHTLVLNAERVAHREPLMYSTIWGQPPHPLPPLVASF